MTDASILFLVPPKIWSLVETRKAPALTMEPVAFHCEQWEKAKQNMRYYKRKQPHVSFTLPI
jgi:hypothetical protein